MFNRKGGTDVTHGRQMLEAQQLSPIAIIWIGVIQQLSDKYVDSNKRRRNSQQFSTILYNSPQLYIQFSTNLDNSMQFFNAMIIHIL